MCVVLPLAACGGGSKEEGGQRRGAQGPLSVGFVVVKSSSVPVVADLPGRTVAFQSSQVRPQVSGVIQRRFFKEGSLVRQGQTLYQIDPQLYRAAVNQAEANFQSAQATASAASVRAERLKPLAEMEAVSKQDYTDANATALQAKASVAQTRAQLETARINLRFSTVPAPITGRIGRSLFTEGALVTVNQADPLATIQRLDPIFVDIQQSSADLLALRRSISQGGLSATQARVKLLLEDGSNYGPTGTIEFSEVTVDPSTGTVTLRATFPNPDGVLLPGMFVRAQFDQAINTRAILVPQEAVTRQATGEASVFLVGPGNKAVRRVITIQRADGANWVVTDGLKAGDKVIVQGTGQLRPDAPIKPVPADTPQRAEPPKRGQRGPGATPDKRG
ncbi:efflux RND transporter periplasmic adaptor subunit [Sphingobium sp. CR28]|uniref:efflux RND transporter periplasmic adaptor subunit n=1 Tax=Sphingobium sp. CR28 TaxID=3400272 RepID=UPI003FED8F7F